MKNKLIIIILALILILPVIASAYTLLQPLPESSGDIVEIGLTDYLSWLYKFALGAVIFLAVLKIVIGGIYVIAGGASEGAQSKGREMIEMALWGLLLAVCAYLLLNVINPDLVKGNFSLQPITIERAPATSSPTGVPSGFIIWPPGSPPAGTVSDTQARTDLANNSNPISINKSDCVHVGQSNCTSLYGLPSSTVQDLKDLANDAGKSLTITGGTEYWLHSTHGPGKPIVDIRFDPSLNSTINSWKSSGKIKSFQCERLGIQVSCTGGSTPDHFHVVFQ